MSSAIWDEKHLKALLRLQRYPWRLIKTDPWQTWIERRGGSKAIYEHLRQLPLTQNQHDLLALIVAHPYASVQVYSDKLHISRRTYANRLSELISDLLPHINAWELKMTGSTRPAFPDLPAPLTSMVGAEESAATVSALLRRSEVRLLTITGPGGVGKTRLAIQVAGEMQSEFPDGIYFVPLADEKLPFALIPAIIQILGIPVAGNQTSIQVLKAYVRQKRCLLILDNFEHLIASAAPVVTDLLQSAPWLKVLITSREILKVYGEYCFQTPTLTLPDPDAPQTLETIAASAAVQLFTERAGAVYPKFTLTEANAIAAADICRCLDGLPLALELAAAYTRVDSLDHILHQLKFRPDSLKQRLRDLPARQQSLRDNLEWSYKLLNEKEQTLFKRLGVFHGWTREAAEDVCELPDECVEMETLVDKSLVQIGVDNDATRFQMLQTTRRYALAQLEIQEGAQATQRRHALHYLALAEAARQAGSTSQQEAWSQRIEQEWLNIQAALHWFLEQNERELVHRLIGAVWHFWEMNGASGEEVYRTGQTSLPGEPAFAVRQIESGLSVPRQLKRAMIREAVMGYATQAPH